MTPGSGPEHKSCSFRSSLVNRLQPGDKRAKKQGECQMNNGQSRQSTDPNGLGVGEFADAVGTKFATVTGGFHAAERYARVGDDHLVDENHAGFEIADKLFAFGGVVGPGARAQPETRVVGDG